MSTPFTDIDAAIEEARYLREYYGKHYKVVQKHEGEMYVRQCQGESKERILRKMFSTRSDSRRDKSQTVWSADEISMLSSLAGKEVAKKIAEKVNRSQSSVIMKAHDIGLSLRTWHGNLSNDERISLAKIKDSGVTYKKLASMHGMSIGSVKWHVGVARKLLNSTFC